MSSVFMVGVTCHWEPLFGSWVGMSKLSNFKPLTKFSKKVTGTAQDRHEASYSPLHGTSYYREVWRTTLQFPSVTHTFFLTVDSGIWLLRLWYLTLISMCPLSTTYRPCSFYGAEYEDSHFMCKWTREKRFRSTSRRDYLYIHGSGKEELGSELSDAGCLFTCVPLGSVTRGRQLGACRGFS